MLQKIKEVNPNILKGAGTVFGALLVAFIAAMFVKDEDKFVQASEDSLKWDGEKYYEEEKEDV